MAPAGPGDRGKPSATGREHRRAHLRCKASGPGWTSAHRWPPAPLPEGRSLPGRGDVPQLRPEFPRHPLWGTSRHATEHPRVRAFLVPHARASLSGWSSYPPWSTCSNVATVGRTRRGPKRQAKKPSSWPATRGGGSRDRPRSSAAAPIPGVAPRPGPTERRPTTTADPLPRPPSPGRRLPSRSTWRFVRSSKLRPRNEIEKVFSRELEAFDA